MAVLVGPGGGGGAGSAASATAAQDGGGGGGGAGFTKWVTLNGMTRLHTEWCVFYPK